MGRRIFDVFFDVFSRIYYLMNFVVTIILFILFADFGKVQHLTSHEQMICLFIVSLRMNLALK